MTKEGDIVVASDSKSKLWRDLRLKQAIKYWNINYVDFCEESMVSVDSAHQH